MKTMPKISVIVPVYNVERYIGDCVGSIMNQSFDDFELILVDDGSPDNSGAICDELAQTDPRISVFHTGNGGVSKARNFGMSKANGEWICFIDSDDYIDKTYLEDFMSAEKSSDLIMQGYKRFYNGRILSSVDFEDLKTQNTEEILACSEYKHIINSPCFKLFKRSIINEHALAFDTGVSFGEDHLFSLSYVKYVRKVTYSKAKGYNYRITDSESLTRRKVPYQQMLYYVKEADRKSKEVLTMCDSEVLSKAFQATYLDNVFRAYRYFFSAGYPFADYKKMVGELRIETIDRRGLERKRRIILTIQGMIPRWLSYFLLKMLFRR